MLLIQVAIIHGACDVMELFCEVDKEAIVRGHCKYHSHPDLGWFILFDNV